MDVRCSTFSTPPLCPLDSHRAAFISMIGMQMDKLTIKSQEALQEAQRIAQRFSHQEVDGEHLLLALIGQADSLIPDLLEKIGVPGAKLRPDLERELERRHKVQGISSTDLFMSATLKKVLDAAQAEAGKLKD